MAGRKIEIKGLGGESIHAYLAVPAQTPAPGCIISHDVFGYDTEPTKAVADMFAERGYVALIPDMFWNLEPVMTEYNGRQVPTWRGIFEEAPAFAVVEAGVLDMRGSADCNGKIGVIGFCAGGTLAYLAAARLGVDCVASFYGTRIHTHLDEVGKIACPTQLHISEHDHTYSDEDRDRIIAAVKPNKAITSWVYKERHGFVHGAKPGTSEVEASKLAYSRMFEMFDKLRTAEAAE
jgi:carboxymethylenebutenolidase